MLHGISKNYEPNIAHIARRLECCDSLREDLSFLYDINCELSDRYLQRYKKTINVRIDKIIARKYYYKTNILHAIVSQILYIEIFPLLDDRDLVLFYATVFSRKPSLICEANSFGLTALSTLLFGLRYYKDLQYPEDVLYKLSCILYYTIASDYGKYFESNIVKKCFAEIMQNTSIVYLHFLAGVFVSSCMFDAGSAYEVYKAKQKIEDKIKFFNDILSHTIQVPQELDALEYIAKLTCHTSFEYSWEKQHVLKVIVSQYFLFSSCADRILCESDTFNKVKQHSLDAIKCIDYYHSAKIDCSILHDIFKRVAKSRDTELMKFLLTCRIRRILHRRGINSMINNAAKRRDLQMTHILKQAFYSTHTIPYLWYKECDAYGSNKSKTIYQNLIIYLFITHPVFEKQQALVDWKLIRGVGTHILWEINDPMYYPMKDELRKAQKELLQDQNIREIIVRGTRKPILENLDLLKYITTDLFKYCSTLECIIYDHLSFLESFNNFRTIGCIIKCLVSNSSDVNKKALYKLILIDVVKQGYAKVAEALVYLGADMNYIDETPLILAAKNQYPDVVRVLTKAGANLDIRDCKGMTALMHSMQNFDLESFNVLVEAGASQNFKGDHSEFLFAAAIEMQDLKHQHIF